MRVETQVAQVVGELDWTVRAIDFPRLDSPHGFDKLVVVGVIGEW